MGKSSWLLMVLWIGWSLFSLCGKTKINILLMHKVLDEDTIKPEILPQIVCGKTCLCSEGDLAEVIPCDLYKLKAWLSMTDNFCFSMMLFSLPVSNMHCNRSRWPLQAYMFSVSLATRACLRHNSFCIVFGNKFNIMSAFLSTNRSLGCKKSILAKVCFDAKRG